MERTIAVGLLDDLTLTLPKNQNRKVETRLRIDTPLLAPIAIGTVIGTFDLYEGDQRLASRPLVALGAVEQGSWWTRGWDTVHLFFVGLFQGWASAEGSNK
jgi:D-alanyl-D-alanine carboxypeptidase (penicillin-binding protein 5/6)